MKARSKVAWKLTAVVAAILTVAIGLSAYAHGLIWSDHSVEPTAAEAGARTIRVVLTAFASLLFGVVAAWFMFALLLERPIRELIEGTKRIAAHQLDFRFDRRRNDEIGVLEDSFNSMTAKIQASQDELRDAKEYLEGIIENSADIVITVNAEGSIEMFNRGGEEILGYQRGEVIGRNIESLYVEPAERRAAAAILETTGHVKNYETRLLAKDGQIRNVLLTLSRLQDSDGRSIGTIGISKDITQEKKLQDELRDAKEYLEGMVENSADIIITVNSEGLIETFNRGGEEALGYRREEVIGKRIESLFVEPGDRHAAAALLEDTGDVKNYETRLLAKDGGVRNVLLTLSWLRDGNGRPIGTIGISKDVTQETQLQRELIQSQKFAAIGQAVTGIQHAIKNMLMSLQGGSYLIRNGMSKDKPQQVEEGRLMLEDGIKRIHGLSHNMLNLARQWRPDLQEVDLYDLVAGLCEANRPTASDQGIVLRHEGKNGLPFARCDPKLIHMAATDILVNAIDACLWKDYHSDEAPEVVLRNSLGDDGNCLVIEVCDNGCGMSEDIKRNLFTPFFSTKETLGTGLGLAVTSKIIKAHEGEIAVESEPDRGSTFRICIPKNGPKDKRGG